MAEQFRGGLRLRPPESEWFRLDPIASDAEAAKNKIWRNKNFRRGIRRGLGGINLFRGSPLRTRADPRRIGGTSAAEMTEKRPPASAIRKVRECPPRTFSKVRVLGTIPPRNNFATDLFRQVRSRLQKLKLRETGIIPGETKKGAAQSGNST